jgi:hypothetical protein
MSERCMLAECSCYMEPLRLIQFDAPGNYNNGRALGHIVRARFVPGNSGLKRWCYRCMEEVEGLVEAQGGSGW